MKIFINDHPIQFELTKEKNVQDLVSALYDMAEKEKMIIDDLTIDGKFYKNNQNLAQSPLAEIKEVHLKMEYPLAFSVNAIKEAEKKLGPYGKNLSRDYVIQSFDEIANHLEWLKKIFEKSGEALSLQEPLEPLQIYLRELNIMLFNVKNQQMEWDFEKANTIITAIRDTLKKMNLRFFIKIVEEFFSRQSQKVQPQKKEIAIKNLNELLQQVIENCEEIAINFQIGKHLDALSKIIDIADAIAIYEKFMSNLIEKNEEMAEKIDKSLLDELKEKLVMIEEASKIKDFVELSDIFEYEMKPALEKIKEKTTALV